MVAQSEEEDSMIRRTGIVFLTGALAAAVIVSGCALPNYKRGPHVKGNQTLEMDLALCRLHAEKAAPLRRVAMTDACMKAKGYIAEKGD